MRRVRMHVAESLVEFRVLGPVEARFGEQRIDIGHARQRAVLAALLLDLNQVVPYEMLIDRVWGADPPSSVRNVLYGYVARLRAALSGAQGQGAVLGRRAGGYVLQAGHDDLDLHVFRRHVTAAEADDDQRADALRHALSLWHGEALAGLVSPWFAAMRATLESQRMATLLDLNDIALRQGRHRSLLRELTELAARHPADERLAGQLMLGLYRSGRQADALRAFEDIRQQLANELGADPGPDLRSLHQQILRSEAPLPPTGQVSLGQATVPRQLPADVTAFTGRQAELAELDRLLAGSPSAGGEMRPVVISAVSGTAGVGKTALAIRWAHRAARSFPDGQLYVNLRGFDPDEPVPAADALAWFLRGLGLAAQDVPAEAESRAALYRSMLTGRRLLVVLDNARDADQVRPLLPGTGGCAVLVTSRESLAGLVARDGARRLDLGLLPIAEAAALLRTLVGSRVDQDAAAAAALAERCSRLPLALRVAAEIVNARPSASLAELVSELDDEQHRLDRLDLGEDPRSAIRAVFSWSYELLDEDTARTFRLAGLHPGAELDVDAVCALTGAARGTARRALDRLARAHLIQSAESRYLMHDLLRAYARDRGVMVEGEPARRAALTGLFDYYLQVAAAAMDTLFPADSQRRPAVTAPPGLAGQLAEPAAARTWLDREQASMLAAAAYAADHGWPSHATQLAMTIWRYLESSGRYSELNAFCACALRAARRTGDRDAEAEAINVMTVVHLRQGRYEQASAQIRRALAIYRETGNRAGAGFALANLGIAQFLMGEYDRAAKYYQQALVVHRETGNVPGQTRTLGNLSLIDMRQGRYEQAGERLRTALDLCRETGDRSSQVVVLANLGLALLRQGEDSQAREYLEQARALSGEVGEQAREIYVLTALGVACLDWGEHARAEAHLVRALELCRETGDESAEVEALNALGQVLLATGQPDQARSAHATALGMAKQAGEQYEQARAHHGLGRVHRATGDFRLAREHLQEAHALYARHAAPEADQVRQLLDAAPDGDPHYA